MGTWDEMKGGKWIQDRPFMWKSIDVDGEKMVRAGVLLSENRLTCIRAFV